jgi:hypothetical protein
MADYFQERKRCYAEVILNSRETNVLNQTPHCKTDTEMAAGLPDFSWCNLPNGEKYTKYPYIISNGHKI